MKRISREFCTTRFDCRAAPVVHIAQGEEVIFETHDAHGGRIQGLGDLLSLKLPHEQCNPATGPAWIEGAGTGDVLAVTIGDIRLGEWGHGRVMSAGVIIDELPNVPAGTLARVKDGMIHFTDAIVFRARPMVGVIGCAPAGKPIATYFPGSHGGNLDINAAGIGCTVYLPVVVPGALLCIGDVHASMGDGELTSCGLDIDAEVTVTCRVLRGLGWQRPVIETSEAWCTCASAATLAGAIKLATSDMATLIARNLRLTREQAFVLIGAAVDARIGQAANLDIDATAYLLISKEIMPGIVSNCV